MSATVVPKYCAHCGNPIDTYEIPEYPWKLDDLWEAVAEIKLTPKLPLVTYSIASALLDLNQRLKGRNL